MKILEQIGLSSNEAKVYIALLKLGNAGVRDISDHAEVKRPTVYFCLDTLIKRGLVTQSVIRGKKQFSAADPDELMALIQRDKDTLNQRAQLLAAAVTKLKAFATTEANGADVRIYEGTGPLWQLADRLLRKRQDMMFVYSGETLLRHASAPDILKKFTTPRRQYGGSKLYAITDRNPISEQRQRQGDVHFREIRFLKEATSLDSILCVVGGTIVLVSLSGKPRAIVVESSPISDLVKFLFWHLWNSLTP